MAVCPTIEALMPTRGICPWPTERSSAESSRAGRVPENGFCMHTIVQRASGDVALSILV